MKYSDCRLCVNGFKSNLNGDDYFCPIERSIREGEDCYSIEEEFDYCDMFKHVENKEETK